MLTSKMANKFQILNAYNITFYILQQVHSPYDTTNKIQYIIDAIYTHTHTLYKIFATYIFIYEYLYNNKCTWTCICYGMGWYSSGFEKLYFMLKFGFLCCWLCIQLPPTIATIFHRRMIQPGACYFYSRISSVELNTFKTGNSSGNINDSTSRSYDDGCSGVP